VSGIQQALFIHSASTQPGVWSINSGVSTWTLSNSDKTVTVPSSTDQGTALCSVTQSTGKRYWEVLLGGTGITSGLPFQPSLGIGNAAFASGVANALLGSTSDGWGFTSDGRILHSASALVTGLGTHAAGQVLIFAVDLSTLKWWVGRNGTWAAGGNPGAGTGEQATISGSAPYCIGFTSNGVDETGTLRTVTADFSYSPPSGFIGWTE